MNDFIEQCRREWRRLGVSDPLAEEMATELASDLSEAEAEGVSAQEFLGRSAFDPPSFAATWAAERGIVPRPQSQEASRRVPVSLVAFTATAAIALVAAAALLLTGCPRNTAHAPVRSVGGRASPLHERCRPGRVDLPGSRDRRARLRRTILGPDAARNHQLPRLVAHDRDIRSVTGLRIPDTGPGKGPTDHQLRP
jgi:predicted small secreted protein